MYKVSIPDPPMYFLIDTYVKARGVKSYRKKKTKVYTTANCWYGDTLPMNTDWGRKGRQKIATACHILFLEALSKQVKPKLDPTKGVQLYVIYSHPNRQFDTGNKGFFWAKLFGDFLEKKGYYTDDKVISEEGYKSIVGEHKLTFIIKQ